MEPDLVKAVERHIGPEQHALGALAGVAVGEIVGPDVTADGGAAGPCAGDGDVVGVRNVNNRDCAGGAACVGGQQQEAAKFVGMILVNDARRGPVGLAEGGGGAGGDTHLAAGVHDARAAQPHVAGAQAAAGHHQVVNIGRVKAPEGNPVSADRGELRISEKVVDAGLRIMQINLPVLKNHPVGKNGRLAEIILGKDVIPHQTAGLAFSGDVGDEVQVLAEIHGLLFEVVEAAVDGTQQVVADFLGVVNSVEAQPVFPPPISRQRGVVEGDVGCPRHGGKGDRVAGVIRIPSECGAHGHGIAARGGKALVEFRLRLAAHRVKRARPVTEPSVASAVNKQRGGEAEFLAGADVLGVNAGDVGAVGVGGERRAIR